MKTIIQLSDLHFGKADEQIVSALKLVIADLKPDVLVVSGDLTQRATRAQFLEAQKFLNSFSCPKIIIPGNHDVPLYNLWRRFVNPHKKFKSIINPLLEDIYQDGEIAIIGLNTSRSLVFTGGRLNNKQLEFVKQKVGALPEKVLKIVATHHPLQHMKSKQALHSLVRAGVNIFLSGHLHNSASKKFEHAHEGKNYWALLVEAGTATSVRYRNEPNAFNVLVADDHKLAVDRYAWQAQEKKFIKMNSEAHSR